MNEALRALGWSDPPDWLQDPTWIYPGMVIVGHLGHRRRRHRQPRRPQRLPTELYDAAKIDGAGLRGRRCAT